MLEIKLVIATIIKNVENGNSTLVLKYYFTIKIVKCYQRGNYYGNKNAD